MDSKSGLCSYLLIYEFVEGASLCFIDVFGHDFMIEDLIVL